MTTGSGPDEPRDPLLELQRRLWITKGTRHLASARLQRADVASQFSVSILSMYTILLGIVEIKPLAPYIVPLSVASSVLVLTVSLLEYSKGYSLAAERLHACALALAPIQTKIELAVRAGTKDEDAILQLRTLYDDVIARCPENHSSIDYERFRAEHRADFGLTAAHAWRVRVAALVQEYFLFATLCLGPVGLGALMLGLNT